MQEITINYIINIFPCNLVWLKAYSTKNYKMFFAGSHGKLTFPVLELKFFQRKFSKKILCI